MNKVFKVIWSEARNAYVVVSEMAKSHGTKSCSTKKLLAMLIATGVMTCASMAPAMATNPAPDDKNIAIGSGASTNTYNYNNVYGDKPITGDIAIGQKAYAWNGGYNEGQDIYIGTHEYYMDFGQGGIVFDHYKWTGKPYYKVVDGSKVAGSIAIGKNSVARTGSTILGDHTYNGKIGDTEITSKTNYMNIQPAVFSTTIGSNTYNAGTLATVTGAFSIASSQFNGSGNTNTVIYGAQNTGATIYGSMNSIESATSNDLATLKYSGIASSVLGFANRTQNANAALIWGTGNEITNSIEAVTGVDFKKWNSMSVSDAQKDAIKAMQSNQYAGGSVMAIGGGNKADYATYSELTGVQNEVTGTKAKAVKYDLVNGYQNTVTEASDVTVIGIKNKVTADGNKVIGDNHKVSGKDNVIFGSADQLTETTVNNAVVLGHNAKVTGEGGVALGAGSVADRANAVSVGSTGANRQIINVAAGEADTDAVNVSQLNAVKETANKGWNLSTNGFGIEATNVQPGEYVDFSGDKNISVSHDRTKVQVKLNENIDVNSIQTNALNSTTGAKLGQVTIAADGKISGVAEGEVSSTSTDAVNGSQLHAVATEAGKHTTLSNGKNTTVESTVKDGQTDYKVNVAGDLTDITSVANGDSKINLNKDSIIISNGNKYFAITNSGIGMSYIGADYSAKSIMLGENGTTISGGLNVAGSKITGVAEGVADTDAVNVGQLNAAVQAGNTDTHIKPGEYGVGADNKVNMDVVDKNGNKVDTVTIKDVAKASDVGNVNNIASDIKNQDGSHTTVVDAVNNLNNKLDNKVGDLNYVEGGKGNYVTNGENTTTSIGKLDQALKDVADTANQGWNLSTNGGEASKVAPGKTVDFSGDKNIIISNDGTNVQVKLNEAITAKTVTTGNTVMNSDGVKVGADVSLNQNGLNVGKDVSVTATAVTAGKTSISDEGVKVGDKTYINDKGLNANGQNITNVADGKVEKDSKDAINGGQLHQAKADINNRIDGVENQVVNNTNRINKLGSRVNKVGAGAAALAALHPMDFDPDDKLTFSAGYGNYGGENAAAIGAYYRPDEKVMFSVAGTVGNGENMVNAGVSFALDRTNHVSNSRTALAREVIDLRGQLAVMGAKMAKMEKAFGMLDETKTKLFPDVPANHWAYEYIAKLAGNGYIEGYPDGNFGGDRLMTRYEFAAMLYRAIEKGAALEEKIIKEFEPELGRIRVDRISGEDGDRDKIERVRVNDTKGERDHYGNKLAK